MHAGIHTPLEAHTPPRSTSPGSTPPKRIPPRKHPPKAQPPGSTPPPGSTHPSPEAPPTVTAADGTHPTGMLSCFIKLSHCYNIFETPKMFSFQNMYMLFKSSVRQCEFTERTSHNREPRANFISCARTMFSTMMQTCHKWCRFCRDNFCAANLCAYKNAFQ